MEDCPICGVRARHSLVAPCSPRFPQHRCRASKLREVEREEAERQTPPPPSYEQRLEDGFRAMTAAEE